MKIGHTESKTRYSAHFGAQFWALEQAADVAKTSRRQMAPNKWKKDYITRLEKRICTKKK